jgi:uncharacterized protein (DUF4415 family)
MTGSKKTMTERERILKAMKTPPPGGDFVWDGKDEDERPLSREEMQAGIEQYRKKRGRPPGSNKVFTTIRFDGDILEAFCGTGPGWQSRMNAALRDWLKRHSPA